MSEIAAFSLAGLGRKALRTKRWWHLEILTGKGFVEIKPLYADFRILCVCYICWGLLGERNPLHPQICHLGSLNSLERGGENLVCKDGFHQEGRMPWAEGLCTRVWWFWGIGEISLKAGQAGDPNL